MAVQYWRNSIMMLLEVESHLFFGDSTKIMKYLYRLNKWYGRCVNWLFFAIGKHAMFSDIHVHFTFGDLVTEIAFWFCSQNVSPKIGLSNTRRNISWHFLFSQMLLYIEVFTLHPLDLQPPTHLPTPLPLWIIIYNRRCVYSLIPYI